MSGPTNGYEIRAVDILNRRIIGAFRGDCLAVSPSGRYFAYSVPDPVRRPGEVNDRVLVSDMGPPDGAEQLHRFVGVYPSPATAARFRSQVMTVLDMVEDGRLLFDRDGFFAAVLERLRQRMRELGSRRFHLPDGSWYWHLKPGFRFGDDVAL